MGSSHPPYLRLEWSDWHRLQSTNEKNCIPSEKGLYRISHSRTSGLEYVGYGDIDERVYRLQLGLSQDEMPFRDPHMAAPCLWALQEEHQGKFWVSWTSVNNPISELRGKKSALIAQYRSITGQSPTANFGRMIDGYSRSSYQRWDKRGEKTGEAVEGQLIGVEPQPWENWKEVDATDWMGYSWTEFESLIPSWSGPNSIRDDTPSGSGMFRVRKPNESVLKQIGSASNLREKIFELREEHSNEDLEISYTSTSFNRRRHWREAENDLIGVHYLATEITPDADDLNKKFQPEDMKYLIDKGEDRTTEFKRELPENGKRFTKDLIGFANTAGGTVLIGVTDDGEIKGLASTQKTQERAVDLATSGNIDPSLNFNLQNIKLNKKDIVVFEVQPAEEIPIARNGTFYTRKGPQTVKMNGRDLHAFFEQSNME